MAYPLNLPLVAFDAKSNAEKPFLLMVFIFARLWMSVLTTLSCPEQVNIIV